jgi:mevalonate pyrophosphate decarboxylase
MAALAMNHEFRKVLNPEMTDAYFTKSIFARRLGSGSACRSVRTSGSLGNQANIKGSSDLYESNFQIHSQKFQELPRYHLISRQRENKFQVPGHDLMHDIPMPKGDLPSAR